jgi:hypothetical protein
LFGYSLPSKPKPSKWEALFINNGSRIMNKEQGTVKLE